MISLLHKSELRCLFRNGQFWSRRSASSHSSVILMPEVPNVTPENNKLLECVSTASLPDYGQLNSISNADAVSFLALDAETSVMDHSESTAVSDLGAQKSFETVIEPVEQMLPSVDYAYYTTVQMMNVTEGDIYMSWIRNLGVRDISLAANRAVSEKYRNPQLFRAVRDVGGNLTKWQQRLVDKYILEGTLNGLDLSEKSQVKLAYYRERTQKEMNEYKINMYFDNNEFCEVGGLEVRNGQDMVEAPEHFLRLCARNIYHIYEGPWTITAAPKIYELFMRYCSNQELRHKVFQEYNIRCSFDYDSTHRDHQINNSSKIQDMRGFRELEATMLGFQTFAEQNLQTKMAGTIDNVENFIECIKPKIVQKFAEQYEDMSKVALKDKVKTIKAMDADFYCFKEAKLKYDLPSQPSLAKYFAFDNVWSRLLTMAKNWFDADFEDVSSTVDRWDPNVKAYKVHSKSVENGQDFYGYLFMDPYRRPTKAPVNQFAPGRDRCDLIGYVPIAYLNMNFWKSPEDGSCVLEFDEMKDLCSEFGKALQHVLCEAPYPHISGLNNIDADAVALRSSLLEKLLYQPEFLEQLSTHQETGQKLPPELAERVVKGRIRMETLSFLKDMYFTDLDWHLWTEPEHKFWWHILRGLYKEYFPWELEDGDYHLLSFGPYTQQGVAGSLYGTRWSEMLACDVLETVAESGFDIQSPNAGMKRYRDTFLAYGGGAAQIDLFRDFQGRGPHINPLFRFYALQKLTPEQESTLFDFNISKPALLDDENQKKQQK